MLRPIIGVTTNLNDDENAMQLNCTYTNALLRAGALPVLLPVTGDPQEVSMYAEMVDGLLLAGGVDVNPTLYGEGQRWESGTISPVRDRFEIELFRAVLAFGSKPILGVCRGHQLINVALGGSLYQDIQSALPGQTIAHRQHQRAVHPSHDVAIEKDTRLHGIFGTDTLAVNSHHHQAVKRLAEGMVISAHAPDGIAEAIELPQHPFCIGVQWHPEQLCSHPGTEAHMKLFTAFAAACSHQA